MRSTSWKESRSWRNSAAALAIGSVAVLTAGTFSLAGAEPAAAARGVTAPADTTIEIRTTGSNLEFSPSRISARQGTRVTIRYINDGNLPHNWVLVKEEADIDVLGPAAFQAGDTDYVPLQHEGKMIAHSPLAKPGETVQVTFEVPAAGEYYFVCLYPGHYNMMVGTLRALN
jgi:azurin